MASAVIEVSLPSMSPVTRLWRGRRGEQQGQLFLSYLGFEQKETFHGENLREISATSLDVKQAVRKVLRYKVLCRQRKKDKEVLI